jgi:hypothetical protein
LRNTLATEGLAANESLTLDGSKEVADGSDGQEDGGCDQSTGIGDDAEVQDNSHDGVDACAYPIRRDHADGIIELGRGRADAEEQGDLDEQDDQGKCA